MKDILKNVLMYVLIFVILISTYMILMTISSLIPSSALENNVRKSSETLVNEGESIKYDLKYKQ